MKLVLTNFSLKYPRLTLVLITVLLAGFLWQFPKVKFDNDPENMLSASEPVRVFHHQVKQRYALYDFVIVGIVNEKDPHGVFNVSTLNRIDKLTKELLYLRRGADGKPVIAIPVTGGRQQVVHLDLTPASAWQRLLGRAFNHDPNKLFDEHGRSAIIAHELIAPSVVDNLKQAELGSLKLEYLMEHPPKTEAEALAIRADAMSNPLYRGTLVSEDERAICLYIPISSKTYSYNVANLVRHLTADWPTQDKVLITGLPVAEDTFGVEMLIQMAFSAPMAGAMIFLLLLLFFRSLALIVAPMLVAVTSVIYAMGLLIGSGYDVHIMSSMIAIFLMPIAVADSVHILSEFFDRYHQFGDKAQTVRHVIDHLFWPMLYTSLTTIAGFTSLAFTPIPPVQIFGLHVAFGVAVAWVLSMTMVPAYIALFVSEKKLAQRHLNAAGGAPSAGMTPLLQKLGDLSASHSGTVLVATLALVAVSIYGISHIRVNDNPVKWFSPGHEIRIADAILNHHFGGTYTAYLTIDELKPDGCNCEEGSRIIAEAAQRRFGSTHPEATATFVATLNRVRALHQSGKIDVNEVFYRLLRQADALDAQIFDGWNLLGDEINYLDPAGLTLDNLPRRLGAVGRAHAAQLDKLLRQLRARGNLAGTRLQDAALAVCDGNTAQTFHAFVLEMQAEITAPPFKRPQVLRYLAGLQQYLRASALVGKSSSVVDAVKKANYELNYQAPPADADAAVRAQYRRRNDAFYAVPPTAAAVAQVYVQLEGMKKKDSLFHLVTRDYHHANLWVQLKSGDNRDMEAVVAAVDRYLAAHPAPFEMQTRWAGLTYLNVVWQDRMVRGMLSSLLGSFIVVLVMMVVLFRSVLWGVLAMLPLTVTITMIYGIIGLVGKDYDMPVAVLSSLTLGLSVDFAIHFLQRARELQRENGDWRATVVQMFREPAQAISRNAITIAVGFTPLLLAPLVPYKTVGFFLATIMILSWLATLLLLPALLQMLQRWVFPRSSAKED